MGPERESRLSTTGSVNSLSSAAWAPDVVSTDSADVSLTPQTGQVRRVNNYRIIRHLGEGATSKVVLCRRETALREDSDEALPAGDELYAVKTFQRSLLRKHRQLGHGRGSLLVGDGLQQVQKEVAILKNLQHDNIVKLREVIDDPEADHMYMVLEYISGGCLLNYDTAAAAYRSPLTGGTLPSAIAASYFSDVLCGLEFLHTNLICHRDLKPENILVGGDGVAKLGDFGLAHYFEEDAVLEPMTSLRSLTRSTSRAQLGDTKGTYGFFAPEMCGGEDHYNGLAADMWAAGVCLWVMCFGTLPYWDEHAMNLFEKIETDPLVFPPSPAPDGVVAAVEAADTPTLPLPPAAATMTESAEANNKPPLPSPPAVAAAAESAAAESAAAVAAAAVGAAEAAVAAAGLAMAAQGTPLSSPHRAKALRKLLRELLERLLDKDPHNRISATEAIEHEWLQSQRSAGAAAAAAAAAVMAAAAEASEEEEKVLRIEAASKLEEEGDATPVEAAAASSAVPHSKPLPPRTAAEAAMAAAASLEASSSGPGQLLGSERKQLRSWRVSVTEEDLRAAITPARHFRLRDSVFGFIALSGLFYRNSTGNSGGSESMSGISASRGGGNGTPGGLTDSNSGRPFGFLRTRDNRNSSGDSHNTSRTASANPLPGIGAVSAAGTAAAGSETASASGSGRARGGGLVERARNRSARGSEADSRSSPGDAASRSGRSAKSGVSGGRGESGGRASDSEEGEVGEDVAEGLDGSFRSHGASMARAESAAEATAGSAAPNSKRGCGCIVM